MCYKRGELLAIFAILAISACALISDDVVPEAEFVHDEFVQDHTLVNSPTKQQEFKAFKSMVKKVDKINIVNKLKTELKKHETQQADKEEKLEKRREQKEESAARAEIAKENVATTNQAPDSKRIRDADKASAEAEQNNKEVQIKNHGDPDGGLIPGTTQPGTSEPVSGGKETARNQGRGENLVIGKIDASNKREVARQAKNEIAGTS